MPTPTLPLLQDPGVATASGPTRQGWARDLAVITGALAIAYVAIGHHAPIASPMRYAVSAREMAASGDWIVPTLNYVPYFEKPILAYWLGALARVLFGGSDLAVQLPSACASLVSLIATYAFGRHWRSPAFGLGAALLLLLSGMFLVFTTVYIPDTILSACLAVTWYAFWRHDRQEGAPTGLASQGWLWLFWLALGLGWLTKGPIAMVLVAAGVAGYLLLQGGPLQVWRGAWRLRPLPGLLIMALVLGPWHVLAWMRDPRFLDYFYIRINVQGFYDASVNHPGPPTYYLPVVVLYLMPWSFFAAPLLGMALWQALVPAVLVRIGRRPAPAAVDAVAPAQRTAEHPEKDRSGALFLASVVVFPLLFLSISASKLATYAMPLYPAIILLVADQVVRLRSRARLPLWLRATLLAQAVLLVLAGVVYWGFFLRMDDVKQVDWSWRGLLIIAGVILIASQLAGGILVWQRRLVSGLAVSGVGVAVVLALILPNTFSIIKYLDGRALARTVALHEGPDDLAVITHSCVQDHSLVWELARPLAVLGSPRELGMGMVTSVTPRGSPWPKNPATGRDLNLYDVERAEVPAQTRLWTDDQLVHDWPLSTRIWLFADQRWIAELLAAHRSIYEVGRTDKITLVTNQPFPGLTGAPMTHYVHGLQ